VVPTATPASADRATVSLPALACAPEEDPVMHRSGRLRAVLASLSLLSVTLLTAAPVAAKPDKGPLGNYQHLVVIYEENHSFDNLYGLWGDVGGDHLDGLADRDAAHTTQIAQNGAAYTCLQRLA